MFEAMSISSSGMSAQRIRMNTISNNIANQDVVGDTKGRFQNPYRRREVMVAPVESPDGKSFGGVQVVDIVGDQTPFEEVFRPGHPMADEEGRILAPNVNPMLEMVDMISATRAYESNVQAFDAARTMFQASLDLLS